MRRGEADGRASGRRGAPGGGGRKAIAFQAADGRRVPSGPQPGGFISPSQALFAYFACIAGKSPAKINLATIITTPLFMKITFALLLLVLTANCLYSEVLRDIRFQGQPLDTLGITEKSYGDLNGIIFQLNDNK